MISKPHRYKNEFHSKNSNLKANHTQMTEINIEKVTLDNIDQLQSIGRQTFYETFAEHNTDEDMQNYLDNSFSPEKLTSELSNQNSEFYFARFNNKIVGYLKINYGIKSYHISHFQSVVLTI
jgi:hypothetical protein